MAVARLATKSVLAPFLALLAIVMLPCTILLLFGTAEIKAVVLWLFVGLPVAGVIFYIYWSLMDPNRLQTEDFQLRNQQLALLGDDQRTLDARAQIVPKPIELPESVPMELSHDA